MDDRRYTVKQNSAGYWQVLEEYLYDDGHKSRPEVVAEFKGETAERDAHEKAEELNKATL